MVVTGRLEDYFVRVSLHNFEELIFEPIFSLPVFVCSPIVRRSLIYVAQKDEFVPICSLRKLFFKPFELGLVLAVSFLPKLRIVVEGVQRKNGEICAWHVDPVPTTLSHTRLNVGEVW